MQTQIRHFNSVLYTPS